MKGVILFLLFLSVNMSAQESSITAGFKERKQKALLMLEKNTAPDTARVNALLMVLGAAYIARQRAEMGAYFEEAVYLSHKLDYPEGLMACYKWKGVDFWGVKKYEIAHQYFDSAIAYGSSSFPAVQRSDRFEKGIADAHRLKGLVLLEQDNLYMALNHFFGALKYYELHPSQQTVLVFQNLSNTYLLVHNPEQALYYAKKNTAFCEKNSMPLSLTIMAYLSVMEIYIEQNNWSQVAVFIDKTSPYIPDSAESMLNSGYYIYKGKLHFEQRQYDSAYVAFKQGFYYSDKSMHTVNKAGALDYLYKTAMKLNFRKEAEKYVTEQEKVAELTGARVSKINAAQNRADFYQSAGNYGKAFIYLQKAMVIRDSLFTENNQIQINRMAAVYESEKKEKEIIKLQNERNIQSVNLRQKSVLIRIYIAAIAVLAVLGFISFRYFRNKQQIQRQQQEIQKQEIRELEQGKQLATIEAMLNGQEEERIRIAKDLHDGLGGLLSGIKLAVMNLQDKVPESIEVSKGFEHTTKMIDQTISEMRKVAHNLMPEILLKFGLDAALTDFCHSIQTSSGLHVIYQRLGIERALSSTLETAIYRIVQELVNNSLKYAAATQIVIQVTKQADRVTVTVEDNGKGFDKGLIGDQSGAGLINIKHRVDYFNGSIDIDSQPGYGTSVTIELNELS
ncbi:MAG TPA: sensor histidine kinase [Chitinophagaceae bacterium]|nr:sensor histidine kinase [Chitinophagaceae bacterium]